MKYGSLLFFVLIIYSGISYAQLSNLKFDVALELDHYIISNVRDLDGTEDLYTGHTFDNGMGILKYVDYPMSIQGGAMFFTKDKSSSSQPNGTYRVDRKVPIYSDLTFTQLKNLVLNVGGLLLEDDEGLLPPRPFFCVDCNQTSDAVPCYRAIRFAEMSSTQTSINNLKNNGLPQALSFGSDKYFELNYYENFKKEDGWVKFKWMVWVTPHN